MKTKRGLAFLLFVPIGLTACSSMTAPISDDSIPQPESAMWDLSEPLEAPDTAVRFTAAPQAGAPLTLDGAVDLAVAGNPGLAEIQARAEGLAAIPPQAGALPDPVLSLNALNFPTDTFNRDQEPMTQFPQITINQALPFPGKLGLRREAAEYTAAAAVEEVEEKRLILVRDVKLVWWNLLYLDQALDIVADNQALLQELVTLTRTKYEVGRGLQQDVLLAQLELSKLVDQEVRLQGMRRIEAARLNALLNRSTDTPVVLPRVTNMMLPSPPSEEALFAQAEKTRPLLAAQRHQIEVAQSQLELARKDYYPDFKVGAGYGFRYGEDAAGDDRPDFASALFSMNLPVFTDKLDSAVNQRRAEVLKQNYALQDARVRVRQEISTAYADYERTLRQFDLFENDIIPQAEQTIESMLAGYQVGQVDFLNLVRAQITLYNFEIQRWNVLSVANQTLARLSAATGKESLTAVIPPVTFSAPTQNARNSGSPVLNEQYPPR